MDLHVEHDPLIFPNQSAPDRHLEDAVHITKKGCCEWSQDHHPMILDLIGSQLDINTGHRRIKEKKKKKLSCEAHALYVLQH